MRVAGVEADDVIGTMATRAHEEGFVVAIASPDKVCQAISACLGPVVATSELCHLDCHDQRAFRLYVCAYVCIARDSAVTARYARAKPHPCFKCVWHKCRLPAAQDLL